MIKRFLPLGGVALLLAACGILTPGGVSPRVSSVSPDANATGVDQNVTVRAVLELSEASIDVSTLTNESVRLVGPVGDVPATRTLEGDTLVLDPSTLLLPNTPYTFSVTEALKTTGGDSVDAFESSFTTGAPPNTGPIGAGDLQPDALRLLFTVPVGGSETRTLTLVNEGESPITISGLTVGGANAASFTLLTEPGFRIGAGQSAGVDVSFSASVAGPQQGTLQIDSTDEVSPTQIVPLGALALAEGQEPSLQWIFDASGIPVRTGDADPTTAELTDGGSSTLLGDEVAAQAFLQREGVFRATAELLAAFSAEGSPVATFGNYLAGTPDITNELIRINAAGTEGAPQNNDQRLQPDFFTRGTLYGDGLVPFTATTTPNGFFGRWFTSSAYGAGTYYTEDTLNSDASPHRVRAYPLKNPDGTVQEDAFVLAFDASGSFAFNDLVVIVRGLEASEGQGGGAPGAGIGGLIMTNAMGLPSPNRMLLSRVNNFSGNACGPQSGPNCNPDRWQSMKFYDSGTLNLTNSGPNALNLSLTSSNPALFTVTPGSVSLQPGQTASATVTFVGKGLPQKGVYPARIDAVVGSERASFSVAGIYQDRPEGSRELLFGDLVKAFGYQTDVGALSSGALPSNEATSKLAGEEVRSAYWKAANPSSPIKVTQIAAYMTCCDGNPAKNDFEFFERGASSFFFRMPYDPDYAQSIYPPSESGKTPNVMSVTTDKTFRFDIAGFSSLGKNGFLGVRFWPLVEANGSRPPNTYIVVQDFALGPCGSSANDEGLASNCDYNDHLYIVENITPVGD